ncbi:MAG: CDP-alcohol phosphatidyltransferase family protein [Bacteroidales bacterium]|nr:CDP-alcohol phosphatidyltransferase family protein [Bacteroidales bacterium]
MALKNHIPNTITLLNLTSGIVSIYFGVKGDPHSLVIAGLFIFIAAVFDFFDGFAARMLHAKSDIGLQLDSLSDMVSFGVAPGFILYQMLVLSHGNPAANDQGFDFVPFFAILVPWMGALRLAKFNIDENQKVSFLGLPTPALALLIASLPIIRAELYPTRQLFYMVITNSYFLLAIAIFGSLLLVSRFPMFALKFTSFAWKPNMIKYIFLTISVILLVLLNIIAVPFIIILYLFFSLIVYLTDIQS